VSTKTPEEVLAEAERWWSTAIINIRPGHIEVRGYPIEQLIGVLSYPEMVWLMLRGDLPSAPQARLLEAALVAAVDHGPQAPSIAISRMAVSCGLPLNGAMASAINALDDVHGGAGQQCMVLLEEIAAATPAGGAEPAQVATLIDRFIERNGKIVPGFGHRFHGVDPRAVRLMALVELARRDGVVSGRYAAIGPLIEQVLTRRKGTPIPMNIDAATAIIYCELGFAPPLGRGLFILSRSVGILAHAWEQSQQGARIKGPMPTSIPFEYTGPATRPFDDAAGSGR
jgi:citrate synthase